MVSAFIQEFDNTEDVCLLLKCYRVDYSKAETDAMINSVRNLHTELNIVFPPEVRMIPFRLPDNDIKMLHRMGDCYISTARAEGTGIPMVDAITCKRPLITTPYGGPSDFTTKESSRWLDYRMIPIQNPVYCYNYFNSNMRWADADILDVRKAMREVYNMKKDEVLSRTSAAQSHLLDQYGFLTNAKIINNILECFKR
jgi:glycosyltransferase involved in cell wall biosynthesis